MKVDVLIYRVHFSAASSSTTTSFSSSAASFPVTSPTILFRYFVLVYTSEEAVVALESIFSGIFEKVKLTIRLPGAVAILSTKRPSVFVVCLFFCLEGKC